MQTLPFPIRAALVHLLAASTCAWGAVKVTLSAPRVILAPLEVVPLTVEVTGAVRDPGCTWSVFRHPEGGTPCTGLPLSLEPDGRVRFHAPGGPGRVAYRLRAISREDPECHADLILEVDAAAAEGKAAAGPAPGPERHLFVTGFRAPAGLDSCVHVPGPGLGRLVGLSCDDLDGGQVLGLGPGGESEVLVRDGEELSTDFGSGIVVLADGGIVLADTGSDRIRLIRNGAVTTLAGSSTPQGKDLPDPFGTRLANPSGLALAGGAILFADQDNHRILKLDGGALRILAGPAPERDHAGEDGFEYPSYDLAPLAGAGVDPGLAFPDQVAPAPDGTLVFTEAGQPRIRALDGKGRVVTLAGQWDRQAYSRDCGHAAGASLNTVPVWVVATVDGEVVFWDQREDGAYQLRMVTRRGELVSLTGTRETREGDPALPATPAASALFFRKYPLAAAPYGGVLIAIRAEEVLFLGPGPGDARLAALVAGYFVRTASLQAEGMGGRRRRAQGTGRGWRCRGRATGPGSGRRCPGGRMEGGSCWRPGAAMTAGGPG